MKVDSISWKDNKRVCVSFSDDLFTAYCRFMKKQPDLVVDAIRKLIKSGEIQNSFHVQQYFYRQLMKPSALACFDNQQVPDQVHIEDL